MFPASLLTTLLFALSTVANPVRRETPPPTFQLARRLNTTSILNLVRHDQRRAHNLKAIISLGNGVVFKAQPNSEPVTNQAVQYTATIGVGTPPTSYTLTVDTGSSNTWIGAGTKYVKTSSSSATSNNVSVSYGSGSFSGREYIDRVTITPDLVISKQSIGVASTSSGFDGVDGILGIGPTDLTTGTLSPASSASIPTLSDNLYADGIISANLIAVSFAPTTSSSVTNGEITWGATDPTKYTGSISYSPITSTSPASGYWGIDMSLTYGTSDSHTTVFSNLAGIVDTGTTLILLASDAFKKYKSDTGAVDDSTTGLIRFTSAQYSKLSSLFFTTNGKSFELIANAQIWPRSLNTDIGGTSSSIYGIVSDLGSNSGEGLDFICGYAFLERFYSVYDTENHRIGLATTSHTTATTN